MQWTQEMTVGATRESQAHLARWIAIRAMELMYNTKCSNSGDTFFPGPRCRGHASSRINLRIAKSLRIWWRWFGNSTARWRRCTQQSKRHSTLKVYAISADLRNYHSHRVRPRSFEVGDRILWLKQDEHKMLESPWLGPYIIMEVILGVAYRLRDKQIGQDEGNPWNAEQLRCFYA
jgi:hypothetical protein